MTKGKGKMGMLRKPLTVVTYNKGYGLQLNCSQVRYCCGYNTVYYHAVRRR
mgnify:CR=1 FL=1